MGIAKTTSPLASLKRPLALVLTAVISSIDAFEKNLI
jgi:hypothetical protein